MKNSLSYLFILATFIFSACREDDTVSDFAKSLTGRGTFEASINGEEWSTESVLITSVDYEDGFFNTLRVKGGENEDPFIVIDFFQNGEEGLFVRDTANPQTSANPNLITIRRGDIEDEDQQTQQWLTGTMDVSLLTIDSLKATFNFTTQDNEVTNGKVDLFIGEK